MNKKIAVGLFILTLIAAVVLFFVENGLAQYWPYLVGSVWLSLLINSPKKTFKVTLATVGFVFVIFKLFGVKHADSVGGAFTDASNKF